MSAKTGGPPFPESPSQRGMSLRDYFAAAAMQGYIAAGIPESATYDDIAEKAYKSADAMLLERDL